MQYCNFQFHFRRLRKNGLKNEMAIKTMMVSTKEVIVTTIMLAASNHLWNIIIGNEKLPEQSSANEQ